MLIYQHNRDHMNSQCADTKALKFLIYTIITDILCDLVTAKY